MTKETDLQRHLDSATEALSTTSPTEAGHPEQEPLSADLIDAINQVFALFRANFHNQYYAAFGNDNQALAITKKLWLQNLAQFAPTTICQGAEKIIAENDFMPTMHKMLEACRSAALPGSMPAPRAAYIEACNTPSPKASQTWSHPAVYLAGRDCGWHFLASSSEQVALKEYTRIYNQYCQKVAGGETLEVIEPIAIEDGSHTPADNSVVKENLSALKKLFE